jgi:hypothetical protein
MISQNKYRQMDVTYNLVKGGGRLGLNNEALAKIFTEES